jgi:AcrR family transcriptional regulator
MTATVHRLQPRKTPRQRRSRATRERILGAAARVFAERGYAGGTTNHIAAEAGLSVGSLYQYFPNKDALAAELMREHAAEAVALVADRLAEVQAGVQAGGGIGLEAALRSFVDAAVANHRGDPELHRVLFEEAPRPPDVLAELHELEAAAVAAGAGLLRADPTVHVADPTLAAWFVVATIESLTHRFMGTGGDIDAFADELVHLLVAYLRAPRAGH